MGSSSGTQSSGGGKGVMDYFDPIGVTQGYIDATKGDVSWGSAIANTIAPGGAGVNIYNVATGKEEFGTHANWFTTPTQSKEHFTQVEETQNIHNQWTEYYNDPKGYYEKYKTQQPESIGNNTPNRLPHTPIYDDYEDSLLED